MGDWDEMMGWRMGWSKLEVLSRELTRRRHNKGGRTLAWIPPIAKDFDEAWREECQLEVGVGWCVGVGGEAEDVVWCGVAWRGVV